MAKNLKEYQKIVGQEVINEIYQKAEKISKKHIVCISSTYQGGGVAEILNTLVFLMNEIGIDFGWRIIHGSPDFFNITKQIHHALQGDQRISLSDRKKKIYYEVNRRFSTFTHLHHDLVLVHDPQPLPLIDFYEKKQPWIFRFHIDLSQPHQDVWRYLKKFLKKYDHLVVSLEGYKKKDLNLPQSIIHPAIDPLSPKNKPLSESARQRYLGRNGINFKKPIISQISRFDKWKDPAGVIRVFERVKKQVDCQLVLLGNTAPDDPEGMGIYNKIIKKYVDHPDITVLVNVDNNDQVVNALQTKSAVVIQKSTREGFGLVVSEALYKGTPVVGSKVGGIPLQVIDGVTGFLHDPYDINGFSQSVIRLLQDEELRNRLGHQAREHVKKNFLITKLMSDWLDLWKRYLA